MQGQLPAHSLSQVLVEEAANLRENLLRFGRAIVAQIMRVRLSLVDLQYGLHTSLTQLAITRTVLLSSRSRVPLVRMAGGKPVMSP